ncbi:MAG: hypothetical protein BWY41_00899 [Candidatus Atribacteria bacterium ADurb.Bin276]|jgi:hypothetical protein|uniref:Uncharacterized protein n=1 Tax=Candidatus Atribacter allofermentans TaxID=1852833 RepID=A0A1V5SZ47_9BACT|nr:MAG: hypothetical protein BWY41_00899 [Candidatus Atribacteria bacterium ADurb.Bin276]
MGKSQVLNINLSKDFFAGFPSFLLYLKFKKVTIEVTYFLKNQNLILKIFFKFTLLPLDRFSCQVVSRNYNVNTFSLVRHSGEHIVRRENLIFYTFFFIGSRDNHSK